MDYKRVMYVPSESIIFNSQSISLFNNSDDASYTDSIPDKIGSFAIDSNGTIEIMFYPHTDGHLEVTNNDTTILSIDFYKFEIFYEKVNILSGNLSWNLNGNVFGFNIIYRNGINHFSYFSLIKRIDRRIYLDTSKNYVLYIDGQISVSDTIAVNSEKYIYIHNDNNIFKCNIYDKNNIFADMNDFTYEDLVKNFNYIKSSNYYVSEKINSEEIDIGSTLYLRGLYRHIAIIPIMNESLIDSVIQYNRFSHIVGDTYVG